MCKAMVAHWSVTVTFLASEKLYDSSWVLKWGQVLKVRGFGFEEQKKNSKKKNWAEEKN